MTSLASEISSLEIGFGVVRFRILGLDGGAAEWVAEPFIVTRHVPGSSVSYAQTMGFGPERAAYDLTLGSTTDFAAFKALIGTRATLTVFTGSATTTGTTAVIGGRSYLQIPSVLLAGIDPGSASNRVGDYVQCRATFQR